MVRLFGPFGQPVALAMYVACLIMASLILGVFISLSVTRVLIIVKVPLCSFLLLAPCPAYWVRLQTQVKTVTKLSCYFMIDKIKSLYISF